MLIPILLTFLSLVGSSPNCGSQIVKIGCFQCTNYLPPLGCNTTTELGYGKSWQLQIKDFGNPEIEEYDVQVGLNALQNAEVDLILLKNEHIAYLREHLSAIDMSEFPLPITDKIWEDFLKPLELSTPNSNGTHYGLPWISDRKVIWYRKDVQDEYLFKNPPWNIREFNRILEDVRGINSTVESDYWFHDYAVYGVKATLEEDLTQQFLEYLEMAGSQLIYDDDAETVTISNKDELIRVLTYVTGWIRDRIVFSEQLTKIKEETNTKWFFKEIAFVRESYSWKRNFLGTVIGQQMRPGWIKGLGSNLQYSFALRKGASHDVYYDIVNSILDYKEDVDGTDVPFLKVIFDKYLTSPLINDGLGSDYYNPGDFCGEKTCDVPYDDKMCDSYYCPHEGAKIISKPYMNETFYLTLSLYLQTTMKQILMTGFVEEHIEKLEEELAKVFNQTPLERVYWYYYFWLVPIVVIFSLVICSFPVGSCVWKCGDAFRGIWIRQRLRKFHIESSETKKNIWEYFKLSLRTVLVFFFILFLFASVGTVFILSYVNTDSAIEQLQGAWKSQLLLRINDALKLLFSEDETDVAMNHAKTKLFELLKTIKATDNSVKFVLDETGMVLASDTPLIRRQYYLDDANHYLALDFNNWASRRWGNVSKVEFSQPFEIESGDEKDIKAYSFQSGYQTIWIDGMKFLDSKLEWNIIILTPSEDLLAVVNLGNAFSVIATLIIVVVSLTVAVTLVILITQSLNKLATVMRKVEGMDLRVDDFKRKSPFTEISTIQERFLELIETLKEYKKYLPSNLNMFQLDDEDEGAGDDSLSILSQSLGFGEIKELDALDMKSVRVENKVQNLAIKQQLAMKSFQKKEVTVILVKLQNFDEFVENVVPDDFIEIHSKYIEQVNNRIIESLGTFTTFFGSEILASYNTSRNCTYHEKGACAAALKLQKDIKKLNQKLMDFDYPPFVLSCAVSSGVAFCGNLGTDTVRSYSVVGPIITRTYVLEKLNYDYESNVMVNREIYDALEEDFRFWPVEIVSFDNGKTKDVIFQLTHKKKKKKKKKKQAETSTPTKDGEEELLEEDLLDDDGGSAYSNLDGILDDIVNSFLDGDYNDAKKSLQPFILKRNAELKKDRKAMQRFFQLLMKLSLEKNQLGGGQSYLPINPKKQITEVKKQRLKPF